jgi:hypothetical protein
MNWTSLFSRWIDNNAKPSNSQESAALLDEARSTILDITRRVESGEIAMVSPTAAAAQQYGAVKQTVFGNREQAVANARAKSAPAPASKPAPQPAKAQAPALHGLAKTSAAFASAKTSRPSPYPSPAQPREVSAAEFSAPRLHMSRQEFEKLRPSEQKRFADEGGRIA